MTRFETGVARKGKERISNDTVWTELDKLSSCISWCVKTGHIKGISAEWEPVWLRPRSIKGEEVLMLDDVKKLLDACFFVVDTPQGKQRHAMWHLYFYTLLAMCTAARPTALLELTAPHKLRHATATWVDKAGLHPGLLLGHSKGSKATDISFTTPPGPRLETQPKSSTRLSAVDG